MVDLTEVRYGNGSVRFFGEVEPTPATSETRDNITINNMGQPGASSRYEVTYMISCDFKMGGAEVRNTFHWTVALSGANRDDRAVAERIEAEVAAFEAERAAQKAE